jgi:hypothetical protein
VLTRRRRRYKRRKVLIAGAAILVVALAAGLAVAAFGGDDDGDAGTEARARNDATAEGLELTSQVLLTQMSRGQVKETYQTLSASCRAKVTRQQWAKHLFGAAAAILQETGTKPADVKVSKVTVRNVEGRGGEVKATLVDADGKTILETPWRRYVHQNDSWRLDDCDVGTPAPAGQEAGGTDG